MILLGLRPPLAERERVEAPRAPEVGDVEERRLRPEHPAVVGRVLADPQQEVVAHGMQVGRVAEDLQLAPHDRTGRRQVDHVERVDLAERDDVAHVPDEPHRIDALALAKPADAAERHEGAGPVPSVVTVVSLSVRGPPDQVGTSVLATRRTPFRSESDHWLRSTPGRSRSPRSASGPGSRCRTCGSRWTPSRVEPSAPVEALGRDVEARPAGVHDPSVGDDRVRVDRVEPALDVDRQHGHQAEARELRRPTDLPALDEPAFARHPAGRVAQRVAGEPASDAG